MAVTIMQWMGGYRDTFLEDMLTFLLPTVSRSSTATRYEDTAPASVATPLLPRLEVKEITKC